MANYQVYTLAGLFLFFLVRRLLEFRARAKAIGPNLPGFRLLVKSPIPLPWKRLKGVSISDQWHWEQRYKFFEQFGCDIVSSTGAFPRVAAGLYVADPVVIKEITSSRARFPKPVRLYRKVSLFGPNIVASEFEEHKKFRKIIAPSFSERNNKLVWDETVRIILALFDTPEWKGSAPVEVEHAVDLTLPIALFVIGAAGFGRQVSWDTDDDVPLGHKMSFKDALNTVSLNLLTKVLVPTWATRLRPQWRRVAVAYDELYLYMTEMIQNRRTAVEKSEHFDLFSGLIDNEDDPASHLTDPEVIGNVFIFLVAGHETTAHSLAFALGLLALYQDEQEKLYQHIVSIIGPDGTIPEYGEINRFTYSLAVIYEALRLYPTVPAIAKYAAEDTVFTTTCTRPDGTHYQREVAVPKGSPIAVSISGMHYNPRYWDNPTEFRPSRFLGDYPRDAFMPFSAGVRACIGRKFSETEGVAILTTLISRYKVTVKDKPEWIGLSVEEKRKHVLEARSILSLTPTHVPLVFTRR